MAIKTFSAFKSYNYRLFFMGQSVSLIGTWMQKTAVSWVIYDLTHSKWMLGVALFTQMFPSFLFSFAGGVVADRVDRYKLLLFTQCAAMMQAILMCLLVYLKHFNVYEIMGLSALLGIINAFDVPARQSLVYEMVDDKALLPNALALNSSMVNLSRLIGPAIAGLVIEHFGEVVCFGSNALSFVAVICSLLLMRLPKYVPRTSQKNALQDMRDGLRYIRRTPSIGFVILMLGFMSLFVLPFNTLIPVYAKDIFHGTASTFGIIDSAIGVGAFIGAMYLASLKPGTDYRKVLARNTFIFGCGLMLFSHTTIYPLALFFASLSAFGMMSQVTLSNTIIQTTVSPSMRGRIISLYAMAYFGMQPLGGLLVGSVSQVIGVENMVLCQGGAAVAIACLHLWVIKNYPTAKSVDSN